MFKPPHVQKEFGGVFTEPTGKFAKKKRSRQKSKRGWAQGVKAQQSEQSINKCFKGDTCESRGECSKPEDRETETQRKREKDRESGQLIFCNGFCATLWHDYDLASVIGTDSGHGQTSSLTLIKLHNQLLV